MPQMAPLMWTYLYMFFSLIFLAFFCCTFFLKLPSKMMSSKVYHYPKIQKEWKW